MERTDAPQPYIRPSKLTAGHDLNDHSDSETTTLNEFDVNEKDKASTPSPITQRKADDDRSDIYQLWLESRKQDDGTLRALGHVRPLTWANIKTGRKVLPFSLRLFSRALREISLTRLWLMIISKATQGVSESNHLFLLL